MKRALKSWIITDYKIPKSEDGQHVTVTVITILIVLVAITELTIDLIATTVPLIISLLLANLMLFWVSFLRKFSKIVAVIQVTILYLLFELHYFILPQTFHVITYWMPTIPIIALVLSGLRAAQVWLLIVLLTLLTNSMYGMSNVGDMYSASIYYRSYLIGGSIFTITYLLIYFVLYNLLGEAYHKLRVKNEEVITLMDKLTEMNDTLEMKVISRTKDIEIQNEKLREYAFMNSHLVRAPLANILGVVEHMNETNNSEEIKEMNNALKVSADNLDSIIREVGESLTEEIDFGKGPENRI